MANYQYGGEQPTDDASKKFMGASFDEGAENSFLAIKGYNLETIHSEKVVDMGVKDNDAAVLLGTINTTGGNINTSIANMSAKLPATLGAKTSAASLSVTMASNEPALTTNADWLSLYLTAATPVPAGSDIVGFSGVALDADDFNIRDAASHYYNIPMAVAGYREIMIGASIVSFDRTIEVDVYGGGAEDERWSYLANFTHPGVTYHFGISEGAVGTGGVTGADPTGTDYSHYPIAAFAGAWPYIILILTANVGNPTAGTVELRVVRRS